MYENLTILVAFIFLYSIVAGKLEKTPVSGAIIFIFFGLVAGPLGFGFLDLNVDGEGLRTLAELTLALVLFTDASNANLSVLKKSFHIPQRLLLVGLPLTILLGFLGGLALFPGLTLLEVAILATMLAPTDAALGKAVVTDEAVPSDIREGLNVESGLNDGICVPILFVFLALISGKSGDSGGSGMLALKLVAEELGIGIAVGVSFTLLGAWLLKKCHQFGWVNETWRQIPIVALAFGCFGMAQTLGGSGFIACFVGGLLFGGIAEKPKEVYLLAAEGSGDTLALITWVVFGAGVIGPSLGAFSWQVVLYALLSLTLVRIVPVILCLKGMDLGMKEKLFMGWFGPRGLASIVFGIIVIGENLEGGEVISMTVVCTILLSVILHGLSASPLAAALARSLKSKEEV